MEIELGVEVDVATPNLMDMAMRAESAGLDLIVLTASPRSEQHGLDPWTTAAFVAGATARIQIGIDLPEGSQETSPAFVQVPAVVDKAHQSLDRLAGPRLLVGSDRWVVATSDSEMTTVSALASGGLPVVIPVGNLDGVDRVADMVAGRMRDPHRRSAAARSRRRSGIDYDTVPESLRPDVIEPGDPGYGAARSNYLRGGAPGIILRPTTPAQVADALDFARRHTHLPLGVRSGGHGVSGRSTNDGGVVIDLKRMNRIDVLDEQRRLVRIEPGATWKQVATALDPHGWAIGSGDYGGVGVGGLATAGGIGFLSRNHGLTIDQLTAVEVVLADGTEVRATPDDHPDLFWGMRGAGANFGVATAFEFEASEVSDVGWAKFVLVTGNIQQTLQQYGELIEAAPRDTTVFLVTGGPRQGQYVVHLFAMVDSDDREIVIDRLTPFLDLGDVLQQEAYITRYASVMGEAPDVGPEGHQGSGEPVSRSALVRAMTPALSSDLAAMLRSRRVYFFQLRAMGGAIGDGPSDATAFTHREAAFHMVALGGDEPQLDAVWGQLARHFDGTYLSFDTDRRPERLNAAFPPAVLDRLRTVKRSYDPTNLFRDNFNIDPNPSSDPPSDPPGGPR